MGIPFNKPFIAGKELYYIAQAVELGNLAGDGEFTQRCSKLMQDRFRIPRILMTPSCTAALEMAMMLYNIGPEDEVILPSYTFVSTANAIVRTGAQPVFVDVDSETLNICLDSMKRAITPRTKALVPVHYAGVCCDMDATRAIATDNDLPIIEDAAQGVNAYWGDESLGSIGALGTYSFHDTKNYICGEGGALCINDENLIERAENIRNKGTNRSKFLRGEVDKYTWVEVGSSYVPNELSCAFLYGQLELLEPIAARRQKIFETYQDSLQPLQNSGHLKLPVIPPNCTSNFHMFYVVLESQQVRGELMGFLRSRGIQAVFHYIPLHSSPMGQQLCPNQQPLPVTEDLSGRLLRLPFYHDITSDEQKSVVDAIAEFFNA